MFPGLNPAFEEWKDVFLELILDDPGITSPQDCPYDEWISKHFPYMNKTALCKYMNHLLRGSKYDGTEVSFREKVKRRYENRIKVRESVQQSKSLV